MTDQDELEFHIRSTWRRMAPPASWRGRATGWNGLDLLTLAAVLHEVKPAVTVVAGGLGTGGLVLFAADCLDHNRRGKLLAGEKMGRERYAAVPEHRRVQWVPQDLLVEDYRTAERLTANASPVLVVTHPSTALEMRDLARLVTPGSYLIVAGDVAFEVTRFPPDVFLLDGSRDPAGLSACAWLLRVPR